MIKALVCVLALGFFFSFQAQAQQSGAYVPGEIIVKLKSQNGSASSYAFLGKAHSDKEMTLKDSWGKMNLYHFSLKPGQDVNQAVQELRNDPDVLYAEPNYYLEKASDVGIQQSFSSEEIHAASFQSQAAFMGTGADINVQSVWSSHAGVPAAKPIIAVIDTGLDINHSVITGTGALWINAEEQSGVPGVDDDGNGYVDDINGWNFVSNNGTMLDDDGHGTHVSGIILSVDQNIFTTPLRESKVLIMPLKFLNGSGVGTTSNAIRAIYYAANNGAKVLNNSWGGASYSAALHEAIAYTYEAGALFVAAAGNSAGNNDASPLYPANYDVPNVLSTAATTDYDYLASFSNYGASTVDLGSPGVYILSTLPNNAFGTSSGTSMATPYVSGTAGQMLVEAPEMLGYQLRTILLSQNDVTSNLTGKVSSSARLDSYAAVNYAKTASVSGEQPTYNLSYGADRQLASNIAGGAGGCGLVRELGSGEGGEPPAGSNGVIFFLIAIPVVVLLILRLRAPVNRRQHDRFKINSDVRISIGDRELVGSVSSISLGGAQINTSALLQDGGLVSLTITAPNGQDKVEVEGRVVWSEANKAYGVAFDRTPQTVLARISDWTRGLQKT